MAELEFLYDFGSPNAYLAWKVLPDLAARAGATLVQTPILLGGVFKLTGNRSPAETLAGVKNKPEYERLETARFVARHGLTRYRMNPHFPVNTLQLMRGAVAAEALGLIEPYRAAIYAGMWEDGLKLDDPAVLAETLTAAGLPAEALMTRSQDPEVKARLLANTEAAAARGVFGAPSFFADGQLYFGKDRLRDVEETLLAAR